MKAERLLITEARALGFVFLRRSRHGEMWRHPITGQIVSLSRAVNTSNQPRTRLNALRSLRRAASAPTPIAS
jgi:hypothetical protein